jgi:broad specificity phosphatase PhoE
VRFDSITSSAMVRAEETAPTIGQALEMPVQQHSSTLNECEAAESEEEIRSYVEQVKAALSATWQKAGFSPDDAEALAAAYELTGTERAVVAGVRRKGTQQASLDIRAALDANNYLLANQLLLGVLVVTREERETAPQSEGARTAP